MFCIFIHFRLFLLLVKAIYRDPFAVTTLKSRVLSDFSNKQLSNRTSDEERNLCTVIPFHFLILHNLHHKFLFINYMDWMFIFWALIHHLFLSYHPLYAPLLWALRCWLIACIAFLLSLLLWTFQTPCPSRKYFLSHPFLLFIPPAPDLAPFSFFLPCNL